MGECETLLLVVAEGPETVEVRCTRYYHTKKVNHIKGDNQHTGTVKVPGGTLFVSWEFEEEE